MSSSFSSLLFSLFSFVVFISLTHIYFPQRADTNKTVGRGKPTLDREEFVRFYNMLTRRPELEEVFLKWVNLFYEWLAVNGTNHTFILIHYPFCESISCTWRKANKDCVLWWVISRYCDRWCRYFLSALCSELDVVCKQWFWLVFLYDVNLRDIFNGTIFWQIFTR